MRVLVVEVMGRHAGWIALHSGLAGGANVILIPEQRFDIEQVCAWVTSRFRASYAPIVVVAEGAMPAEDGELVLKDGTHDSFGHVRLSGVGEWLAKEIERRTGKEARTTVLGHVQRGGTPSAFDRWLATRFGLHAIDAVRDGDFGEDGRPAWHGHRAGADRGGDRPSSRRSTRRSTRRSASSSAELGEHGGYGPYIRGYPARTPACREKSWKSWHSVCSPTRSR